MRHQIGIRITPEQLALYESAAARSGLTRHGWIVAVLAGERGLKRADRYSIAHAHASESRHSGLLMVTTRQAPLYYKILGQARSIGIPVSGWIVQMLDAAAGRIEFMSQLKQAYGLTGKAAK